MTRFDPYAEVKLRMYDWAKRQALGIEGLSHSGSSPIAKMIEYGEVTSGGKSGPRIPRYYAMKHAAEVDAVISEWKTGKNSKYYMVLWCQYVGAEGEGMSGKDKFTAASCSENTYYRRLSKALDMVAAELNIPIGCRKGLRLLR